MPQDPSKDALRLAVLSARELLTAADWAAEDASRTAALLAIADRMTPGTVALYASRPGEPGTDALLDGFTARGWDILLPVIAKRVYWARLEPETELVLGWGGIPQPVGPRLPAEALAEATLIVAPCLALGEDLTRLGTGGGWYDRALLHRSPAAPVVALTREAELLPTVPVEPHDQRVDGYVTEHRSVLVDR